MSSEPRNYTLYMLNERRRDAYKIKKKKYLLPRLYNKIIYHDYLINMLNLYKRIKMSK